MEGRQPHDESSRHIIGDIGWHDEEVANQHFPYFCHLAITFQGVPEHKNPFSQGVGSKEDSKLAQCHCHLITFNDTKDVSGLERPYRDPHKVFPQLLGKPHWNQTD